MKNLSELVFQAEQYLEDQGYKASVMGNYRHVWNQFKKHCEENNTDLPDRPEALRIIKEVFPEERYNTRNIVFHRNAINRLFDLEESGAFPKGYASSRYSAPPCYVDICTAYESYLVKKGLSQSTVKGKLAGAKRFLTFIADNGITGIYQLQPQHVYTYISTINSKTTVARSAVLFFIRGFLKYLVDNHDADGLLSKVLPVILVNNNESLPSVYDTEEITQAINAIDESSCCARRDRAVIMLAVQLGLRTGDIRKLQYDEIDWRLRTVAIIQDKTKKPLHLPLPEECFYSLLDYLKNERPKSDDSHIFVRSRAPHTIYTRSAFYQIISGCFARAGVDTCNRHKGLHALRHSSAVNMLLSETPYPVISGILGHENANTTKRYLRMDIKHLRQLALEVPYVC